MNEFIIVTDKETGQRVILPLNKFLSILEVDNGNCFIETSINNEGTSTGIVTEESFEEIMSILSQKILVN